MKMKLSKRDRKKVRGVVLTTELVLLLIAIIIFATVAFFGIARTVIQQATNTKTSFAVIRADAWKVGNYIVVTAYVQNTGSTSVTVTLTSITDGDRFCRISSGASTGGSSSATLAPGEAKVLSGITESCTYIAAGNKVFVIVSAGSQQVGMATVVNNPP